MRRIVALLAVTALIAVPLLVAPAGAAEPEGVPPKDHGVALSSGELRAAVAALEAGEAPGVEAIGGRIVVEVHYEGPEVAARALVAEAGGEVNGYVPGRLLQALAPFDRLEWLEAQPGIRFLRVPLDSGPEYLPPAPPAESLVQPRTAITGQEVAESNADAWHTAGYTGDGIQVGIVDYFSQTRWNNAQANGDLPAPAGTFCRNNGVSCNIWGSDDHGEGVAEIIHEMAPDADIYIATVNTTADLQAAVDWFDTQGVDIVSRSLTHRYDGPGDGTGPIADVIDDAVSKGMFWANSAGNNAGTSSGDGSYWRAQWYDPDNDGIMNFSDDILDSAAEYLHFDCAYINGLRWSDWGESNPTDYDVYVYDWVSPTQVGPLLASSTDYQGSGSSNEPLEIFSYSPCNGGTDFLKIVRFNANNGSTGDILEFMINGRPVEHSTNPYSASGPASDTDNPGAVSVGAIDPATGNTIASYSSQGPTNDNRKKPDLSAQACVSSFTYSPGQNGRSCFNGTSAATPVVAGAAALILESPAASTPAEIKSYLLGNAVSDRGGVGVDNVYGAGELLLPDPPAEVFCDGKTPTVWGTEGTDALYGTPGPDVIVGLGGADYIIGYGGNDTICAGEGDDYVDGRTGQDRIFGEGGNDLLVGGDGGDWIAGGADNDVIQPGAGADTVLGGWGIDRVSYLDATAGVVIDLDTGIVSGGDTDLLGGVEDADGSAYDDTLIGTGGDNTLYGRGGNDRISGRAGADTLLGQGGDDRLFGQGSSDVLLGGDGNDVLDPGPGLDAVDGGPGSDKVMYRRTPAGIVLDLRYGTVTGGDEDTLVSVERAEGSPYDDVLRGSFERNVFYGRGGDDRLFGYAGKDILIGNAGHDHAFGNKGNDLCDAEVVDLCER